LMVFAYTDYLCQIDRAKPRVYFAFEKIIDPSILSSGDPIDKEIAMKGYYQVKVYKLSNLLAKDGIGKSVVVNLEFSETKQSQLRSIEVLNPTEGVDFRVKVLRTE